MTGIIKRLKSIETVLLENPDYSTENVGFIEFKNKTVITDNMIRYFGKEIIVKPVPQSNSNIYDYKSEYHDGYEWNGYEWYWCKDWFEDNFLSKEDFNIE